MAMQHVWRMLTKWFGKNQRKIFQVTNIVGAFTTTGLAVEAGYRSCETVRQMKAEANGKDIPKIEYVKKCATHFIPTFLSLGLTVGSGIAAGVSANKEIAMSSAMAAASELALKELRDQVKEKIGEKKAALLEADILQKKIDANPPTQETVITTGYGNDVCYDPWCDRYFYTSAEYLQKVQNDMNARLLREMYVTFNEVYAELGLKRCEFGDIFGWNVDHMIDFWISTCQDEFGHPILVLNHHESPVNIRGKDVMYS